MSDIYLNLYPNADETDTHNFTWKPIIFPAPFAEPLLYLRLYCSSFMVPYKLQKTLHCVSTDMLSM